MKRLASLRKRPMTDLTRVAATLPAFKAFSGFSSSQENESALTWIIANRLCNNWFRLLVYFVVKTQTLFEITHVKYIIYQYSNFLVQIRALLYLFLSIVFHSQQIPAKRPFLYLFYIYLLIDTIKRWIRVQWGVKYCSNSATRLGDVVKRVKVAAVKMDASMHIWEYPELN